MEISYKTRQATEGGDRRKCKGRGRVRLISHVERRQSDKEKWEGTDGGRERKRKVVAGSSLSPVPTGLRDLPAVQVQQSSRLD